MARFSYAFLLAALLFLSTLAAENRTWTNTEGKTVEGELISVSENQATLRLSNGSVSKVSITDLSPQDQTYIKHWKPKKPMHLPEYCKYRNGYWYAVIFEEGTWEEAKAKAEKMKGTLVTIPDAETNKLIQDMTYGAKAWIGLSDSHVEGVFRWVDGNLVTYKNWGVGKPDNAGNQEDWVHMNGELGKWNDMPKNGKSAAFSVQWEAK